MAMNPGVAYPKGSRTGLAGDLMAVVETVLPDNAFPNVSTEEMVGGIMLGIATAIVAHIQNNAEVSTTVAKGIACYVSPATHAGQTNGTGSGSGTVT